MKDHQKTVRPSVIINRAVPGSGKTTLARCVTEFLRCQGLTVATHSTDELFMTSQGTYAFDVSRLREFHMKTLALFTQSLQKNIDVVICDNTNLSPWSTAPYTRVAREYGRFILYITFEPRELAKHVESQRVTPEKTDAHGVPEEILVRFIQEYRTYDILLDKNAQKDPEKHKSFIWNQSTCSKEKIQEISDYFDLDALVRVFPEDYQSLQDTLGEKVFQILQY